MRFRLLMVKRIRMAWKLSAVFIAVTLLILVASGYVNNLIEEHYAVTTAREVSRSYFDTIRGSLPGLMMNRDINGIRELMGNLVENNPVCSNIRLVSHEEGTVVAPRMNDHGATLNQDHRSCRICHELENPDERLAVKNHDEILKLADGERVLSITAPIFNEEGCRNAACHAHADAAPVLGLLEADFTLSKVDDRISRSNLRTIFFVVITAMLCCGAAWFFVNRFLKRPVDKLTDGMNKLAEKKFNFRLDEDGKDEFEPLAASFNDVASMFSASLTELTKTRDYLRSILESSADIIIIVNTSGNIQTINKGAEQVLGHLRLEVTGKPVDMLLANPQEKKAVARQLKIKDDVVNYETQFLTKSGEARDVLLTLSQLRNPSGALVGTIGIGKDITEEKRLQQELIQSQRLAAVGQVFTGIQHSMKNMLNACKGGAFMVKTGLARDDRKMFEEGWGMVQEGISRLTDMSMNMLKYVKEWKPTLERADLAPTLSDIDRVIKQTAKDAGVEFRLEIATHLPEVTCDPKMIHSAVMDIVSNALDACLWKDYPDGEQPKIRVSAYPDQEGQELIIEIEDNGCGMTEEVKENIFTPFFSTKSKAGTGLGLSITSRIIGVHGGRIDVESEPNRGTTFRIGLPLDGAGRNKENIDDKKGSGG